jgi:hypothetical protein
MRWPCSQQPEIYERNKKWIVRWYDPTTKRVRAYRTANKQIAQIFFKQLKGQTQ